MTSNPAYSGQTTSSLNLPQERDLAPVLDFRCLFTRDIKRKQKRWHDGRLKFHTFNKRIMVYDDASNFVGDSYWQENGELKEGEELSLERNGIFVEVGEYMGKRDQDLKELMDSRARIREIGTVTNFTPESFSRFPKETIQRKIIGSNFRRSNVVSLETPVGQSSKEPNSNYDKIDKPEDQVENFAQGPSGHEPWNKRRKHNIPPTRKGTYTQSLTGTRVVLTSKPSCSIPISYKPIKVKSVISNSSRITIDLTKEDEKNKPKNVEKEREESVSFSHQACKSRKHAPSFQKPKSGYASKLAGANLTISSPGFLPQKHINNKIMENPGNIRQEILDLQAPISASIKNNENPLFFGENMVTDSEFLSLISPNTHPKKRKSLNSLESTLNHTQVEKKDYPRENRTRPVIQESDPPSCRSSLPAASEPKIIPKDSDSECCTTNRGKVVMAKSDRDRPKSTLRIKSKPPRKMMFMAKSVAHGPLNAHSEAKSRISPTVLEGQKHIPLNTSREIKKIDSLRKISTTAQRTPDRPPSSHVCTVNYNHAQAFGDHSSMTGIEFHQQRSIRKNSPKSKSTSKPIDDNSARPANDKILLASSHGQISRSERKDVNQQFEEPTSNFFKSSETLADHIGKSEEASKIGSISSKLTSLKTSLKTSLGIKPVQIDDRLDTQTLNEAPLGISHQENFRATSKSLLSNPATRGIPLHTITATTADSLHIDIETLISSSPPLDRMEDLVYEKKNSNVPSQGNVTSLLGPWSRESFDLFASLKNKYDEMVFLRIIDNYAGSLKPSNFYLDLEEGRIKRPLEKYHLLADLLCFIDFQEN
ncbi:hypothetical protein Golomagni_01968 [Golovinomyces magnicellulatus]|nr:hypothetical protein Golomagni_01968 [Golovinomyces magnicellulatus]